MWYVKLTLSSSPIRVTYQTEVTYQSKGGRVSNIKCGWLERVRVVRIKSAFETGFQRLLP